MENSDEKAVLLGEDSTDMQHSPSAFDNLSEKQNERLTLIDRKWTPDIMIMLVGKTGSGKSATGNTILDQEAYVSDVSPESVTKESARKDGWVEGRKISVIDTPGVFDDSMDDKMLRDELKMSILMSAPGPHVFLLVISVAGRFTTEEMNAVQWIKDNFGEDAPKYTMVLFTNAERLNGKTVSQYVEMSSVLKKVLADCENRYHALNNTAKEDRTQVKKLLTKIEEMVKENGGQHYTNEMYKTAQKKIKRKEGLEKLKEVALGVASGVGVAGAVAGGVVLGVTELVAIPAVALTGGAIAAVGCGINLAVNAVQKKKEEKKRQRKAEDKAMYSNKDSVESPEIKLN